MFGISALFAGGVAKVGGRGAAIAFQKRQRHRHAGSRDDPQHADCQQNRQPQPLAVENLYFFKNLKTAMPVSQAKGVILLAAAEYGATIKEFTPLQVKMTVCGDGRADKKRVAAMLRYSIALPNRVLLDDETDALAIALTTLVHKEISS